MSEPLDHRLLAAKSFNHCWTILDDNVLTPETAVDILTSAFASRWHWLEAGGTRQWITSDWMVSRVAGFAGYPELAVDYALRAQAALVPDLPDFLYASVAEGVARAYAVAGNTAARDEWLVRAADLVARIEDDEDRSIIAEQLASVPR